MVAAEGGPARQLTDGEFDATHPRGRPTAGMAFASARHPDRDEDGGPTSGWCPSGAARRAGSTRTAGPVSWPAFSPDGRAVAYLGHADTRGVSRHHRLYVVPAGGRRAGRLTAASTAPASR